MTTIAQSAAALLLPAAGALAAAAPAPPGGGPGWLVALAAYGAIYGLIVAFLLSGWHRTLRRRIEQAISVRFMVHLVYAFFVVAALHLVSVPFLLWQARAGGAGAGSGWISAGVFLLGSIGVLVGAVLEVYLLIRRAPRLWWLWSALALCLGAEVLTAGLALVGQGGVAPGPGAPAAAPVASFLRARGFDPADVEVVDHPLPLQGGAGAYMPWIGRPKILLSRSMLDAGYTAGELRFVVAHELGHIALGHGWKSSLARLGQVLLIFLAAALAGGWLIARFPGRLRLRSLAEIESLPLLFLLLSAASLLSTPLVSAYARVREVQADRFALEATGDVDAAVSYFRKIAASAGPSSAALTPVGELFRGHPSPESRIRFARTVVAPRPVAPAAAAPGS